MTDDKIVRYAHRFMQWKFGEWIREDATQQAIMAGLEASRAGLTNRIIKLRMWQAAWRLVKQFSRPLSMEDVEIDEEDIRESF